MISHKCAPLVVDLDGTLTPTDTLVESVIKLVRQSPNNLLRIPLWLLRGKAAFKEAVALAAELPPDSIPYRESLLTYLRNEKANGRQIILATATHKIIAAKVSTYLGLFDKVLATDAGRNLKGKSKLHAILETVGPRFVYAGDSRADLPIWEAAEAAILVGASARTSALVQRVTLIEKTFHEPAAGLSVWLHALRVHQWVKNLLLFVPLLTAFSFLEIGNLVTSTAAFLAFSLAASATYVMNDLWDLETDRAHPRKRLRPLASATLPILHALAIGSVSLVIALFIAYTISKSFFLMVIIYLMLTGTYSWLMKEHILLDVLVLALLYTLRILAGSVALGIATSWWLFAFSVFVFLSLALIKRCAELVSAEQRGVAAARGRDYLVADLTVLWPMGIGAALSSVVVFCLFINAPETQVRYATPELLWLVALGLVYWLGRLWIKTSRGQMYDDPVIFAMKDFGSRVTIVAMIAAMLAAHFFVLDVPF